MQLFMQPTDVWLFRDGRPFDALSDHRAESLFPPYPSVMQGVIRSHHLAVNNIDLRDSQKIRATVGTTYEYLHLRVCGPMLARRGEDGCLRRYHPVPADVVPLDDGQIRSLAPRERPAGVTSNNPTSLLLMSDEEPRKGDFGAWLDEETLGHCLAGQSVRALGNNAFFERENRTSIGQDERRGVTHDGALYEVEFIRALSNVGLWMEVSGYDGWPADGVLRIGGESRGAVFTQTATTSWPTPIDPLPDKFKVYFATPTYFNAGWQPDDWNRFFDGEVALQAAALKQYESIGGYDWANKKHKASKRYVPAGSVYFFQSLRPSRLRQDLIQNAIADSGAEIGFGQILIKEW